jgi:hypothetical protein
MMIEGRMHLRRPCKALDHHDVRNLVEATHFAEKRGKPLNTTITIHPKLLDQCPSDIGRWVSWLLNKLRIWCERDRGFGYYGIWVRESYDGGGREHLHVMLYVPKGERPALEDALRRWLPGAAEAVQFGTPEFRIDRHGQRTNKALTYMIKQMTPQAWFALEKRVRREKHCRQTHAPVAAVLGKRCGTSRTLNATTRRTLWAAPTPGRDIDENYRSARNFG